MESFYILHCNLYKMRLLRCKQTFPRPCLSKNVKLFSAIITLHFRMFRIILTSSSSSEVCLTFSSSHVAILYLYFRLTSDQWPDVSVSSDAPQPGEAGPWRGQAVPAALLDSGAVWPGQWPGDRAQHLSQAGEQTIWRVNTEKMRIMSVMFCQSIKLTTNSYLMLIAVGSIV